VQPTVPLIRHFYRNVLADQRCIGRPLDGYIHAIPSHHLYNRRGAWRYVCTTVTKDKLDQRPLVKLAL